MSYEEKVKAIRKLKKYQKDQKKVNGSLLLNEAWEPIFLKKGEESCLTFLHQVTGKMIEKEEALSIMKGLLRFVSLKDIDAFIQDYNVLHEEKDGKVTDLQSYCNELQKLEKEELLNIKMKKKDDKGFVYFLQDSADGSVKIGKTKDIKERIKKHQQDFNYRLEELGFIFSYYHSKTEKLFHDYFESKQFTKSETGDKEWFHLSRQEIMMIVEGESSFPQHILNSTKMVI